MNRLRSTLALAALSTSLFGGLAFAQDRDHHDNDKDKQKYSEHHEWKKGEHMRHEDWDRGQRVDYRQYHLNEPPRGYEWRLIDGRYMLVNTGTFEIHTIVIAR